MGGRETAFFMRGMDDIHGNDIHIEDLDICHRRIGADFKAHQLKYLTN